MAAISAQSRPFDDAQALRVRVEELASGDAPGDLGIDRRTVSESAARSRKSAADVRGVTAMWLRRYVAGEGRCPS